MSTSAVINPERLESVVGDLGSHAAAAAGLAMFELGDRLGLYRALAGAGPTTASDLAGRTGCEQRLVAEWLFSQAAAGYLQYDESSDTFELGLEESVVLADDDSPAFFGGVAQIIRSFFLDGDRLAAAFKGDGGLAWDQHHECLYSGTDRFFGHTYRHFLVPEWIPKIDGLVDALTDGGRVLEVGCGSGIALVEMAIAFPEASFVGVDSHPRAIERAQDRAATAGVGNRVSFKVGYADQIAPSGCFDAVFFIEALHDMGDPDAAIRQAGSNLAEDGVVVAIEINAGDTRSEQIADPMAPLQFAASTALCTPGALAQRGPRALGNQVGVARWREIFAENGFSTLENLDRTPNMMVLAARR
ncbi:MAG: class I SAM-dependent methyltransferase [Acidimicrobiales bacterium]